MTSARTDILRVALGGGDAFERHLLRMALGRRHLAVVAEAASVEDLALLCGAGGRSPTLRERVIEAVEMGPSRRKAANPCVSAL